jgi:hypothetical protein
MTTADPHDNMTTAGTPTRPIFGMDVPCPQCSYNLRGLVEPICPECGERFDPQRVLDHVRRRELQPRTWHVIWNVVRHPVAAWSMPDVLHGWGATPGQLVAFPALGLGVCAVAGLIAAGRLPEPFGLGLALIGYFLITTGLILLHRLLCWLGLCLWGMRDRSADAGIILGYNTVWLIALVPCALIGNGVAFDIIIRQSYAGHASPPTALAYSVAVFCLVGLLLASLCWTISLYKGMCMAVRCPNLLAIWCALSNPFLWVSALTGLQILYALR